MWLYLIIFLIPCVAYASGGEINRSKSFLVAYTLFLALFVGLSDMFGGYDRYIYGQVFDGMADKITNNHSVFTSASFLAFEPGFSFLSYLIALVSENRYIYILIITLIIYLNLYKTFQRHISNYPFAYILFLGMMFFFTFTYLRQVVAFTFAWLGIQYMLEKNRKKFFVVLIIVALLHKSGLVFAALMFLPLKKWTKNQVVWMLMGCTVIGLSGITSSLYDMVASSGLAGAVNEYSAEGATRMAYILEVFFFAWIILKNYDRIEENRQNLIFLNMAWMFCAMLLLFVRSSDGGRVAWYFAIGIIYTLTQIVSSKKIDLAYYTKSSVSTILIVVMLALYVRVYFAWEPFNLLYPYKTFLSNGRRTPDYTFDRYEYDYAYVRDKFYRPAFRALK